MNILAIKLRHVGDNLLAGVALSLLKKKYPDAHITYLIPPGCGEELIRHQPYVDEVVIYPSGYRERCRLARALRNKHISLSVDFSWDTRSAVWGMLSGASERLGYHFRKNIPSWPLYTRSRPMGQGHTVAANVELVELAGARAMSPEDWKLRIHVPSEAARKADEILHGAGVPDEQGILLVHPASRWSFKCWTNEANAELLDRAEGELGLRPVVTCGPADNERERISRIVSLCKTRPVVLAGQTDLALLAALIRRARVFVGVDSAPVHIAGGVGTPVVVLFGPSGQKEWHPWGVPYRSIQRLGWSCCPCGKDGCAGSKRSRCLDDIRASEVVDAIKEILLEISSLPVSPA